MDEHIDYENIFTPQGMLGHVSKNPNLDFLMNIFNIPRVYSVSGFGTWNVGQHTMAVDPSRRKLIKQMYTRQREDILAYAEKASIDQNRAGEFLKHMKL